MFFIKRQVQTAVQGTRLSAWRLTQDIMDSCRDARLELYRKFPIDLVATADQFDKRPPHRTRERRVRESTQRRAQLTEKQHDQLRQLDSALTTAAREVISALNDAGQLIEEQYISGREFYGRYHTLVVRLVHIVEPVRRSIEVSQGGNYGHRLLRMRQRALDYNDGHSKHRKVVIAVTCGGERRILHDGASSGLQRRMMAKVRRLKYFR